MSNLFSHDYTYLLGFITVLKTYKQPMSQTDTSRKMTHILSCKRFMDLENLNKAELYFEKSNDQIIALDRQLFRLQQRYATLTNT